MGTAAPPETAPTRPWAVPRLTERIRSMRVLLAVAGHGSTARAAEAIHLSQPAVARSIVELEKACGLELFVRTARGMVATQPGTRLVGRTGTVFEHLACGAAEALAAAPSTARQPASPERFPSVVSAGSLRALIAITACGSEASAAQSLGVTQPAVHAALQALEQVLGVRLFYKMAAGTRLTPAGEALLRRVKLALAEIKAMENDLAAWRGDIRGRIVVGVLPLSVSMFLPRAIEALVHEHPNIAIQIVDGTYESLVQQLLSADVDAIAGALRGDTARDEIRQLHLFDDELAVIARAGHPCLKRRALRLKDLLQWEWVTPLPGTPADRALEELFRSEGLEPPQQGLQASSPALTQAFVMQTGRLALASRGQVLAENHGGQLCIVPLALPSTARRIGVTTRALGEPAHDLQLFLQACQAAVASPA
ncbi:LysR family transcriptional regulator [Azohydromonas caseinilytica]|uniref:LysR family transcriptional regulator n=1 Tax=Azohydromonas caseinilytica TaxID=2728836 RepID=A0A848FKH3_9BURK|nr:LysR family transcriptional regulator [Azohydromonas caseinilytica]NML18829.1 LysR family transcriptional regulator [Azohydromonas caseinilytica]